MVESPQLTVTSQHSCSPSPTAQRSLQKAVVYMFYHVYMYTYVYKYVYNLVYMYTHVYIYMYDLVYMFIGFFRYLFDKPKPLKQSLYV